MVLANSKLSALREQEATDPEYSKIIINSVSKDKELENPHKVFL